MAVSSAEGSNASENLSVYRLRWIGYGLLLFFLIDTGHSFLMANPADPRFGISLIGQSVERVVIPLLGFALVFFGEFYGRRSLEKLALRILSWLCLLLAIAYFLMIPPLLLQTYNLKSQVNARAKEFQTAQLEQLQKVEDQLKSSSPEDIKKIATQLSAMGAPVDPNKPDAVKTQIEERIKTMRQQIPIQVQQRLGEFKGLNRNAAKWTLGAIISGVLFIYLWKSSKWAR
jgi:hypothetical protein